MTLLHSKYKNELKENLKGLSLRWMVAVNLRLNQNP